MYSFANQNIFKLWSSHHEKIAHSFAKGLSARPLCDLTRFSILSFQIYKDFKKCSKLMDLLHIREWLLGMGTISGDNLKN